MRVVRLCGQGVRAADCKKLAESPEGIFAKQKIPPERLFRGYSFGQLVLATHLSEAIAAVHGTIGLGLEGNLGLTAAAGTGSGEELTGTTGAVLASVTAGLAALGIVLEATNCLEFLFTGGENEFLAALFAN